ncbi:homeodomain-like protein [Vibrio phage 1.101.O._10N.261.45.C6]|nr:homeodomain-like protein [Vibrio phage 1.101.O._10N.261.45.C6]
MRDFNLKEETRKFQKSLIEQALIFNSSDVTKTSKSLGISRASLYRKMKELKVFTEEKENN